jgi:hypothetical protein
MSTPKLHVAALSERVELLLAQITSELRCSRRGCLCQRRHGPLHCPVPSHGQGRGDRSPSLGVTERDGRLLVHCYSGCPQQDLIETLERRGLWPRRGQAARRPARRRSLLDEARAAALAEAHRQARRLALYREAFADAEVLRFMYRVVAHARRLITTLGPDDPHTWGLARSAADLERDALNWELSLS